MSSITIFTLIAIIFCCTFLVVYILLQYFFRNKAEERISLIANETDSNSSKNFFSLNQSIFFKFLFGKISKFSSQPDKELTSKIRVKFSNAGFVNSSSIAVYYAFKTVLFIAFPLLVWLSSIYLTNGIEWKLLYLSILSGAAIGYYTPDILIEFLIKRRQRELFLVFPDALDLLRVCVEAGLGLDSAIERVGREIRIESVALSDEFSLLDLELRAGSARSTSLRNLATRIGLEDIQSLVSMLIQADRFGTSIVDSLRVHSQSLRTKRRLQAEESAAKLPVKILLPLVFCVFPALLTVLMGPAVINIAQILMPRINGN